MAKRKKSVSLLLCICLAALVSACGVKQAAEPPDVSQPKKTQSAAPRKQSEPPDVYIADGPFAVGALIPGEEDDWPWQIAYGSFPHIACDYGLQPLADEFARRQLNPEGKLSKSGLDDWGYTVTGGMEARESFLRKWEDSYIVLYNGEDNYDEERIYFEASPVNLLLQLNLTGGDLAYLQSEGDAVTAVEIAKTRDALVFVTWEGNSIDGLTTEQARDLMSGAITDWSQLGGEALPVERYYNVGNISLLSMLIMNGEWIADPVMDSQSIPNGVGTDSPGYTIETYAAFTGMPGSFGVMSYDDAKDMEGVKILSLDGIAPSDAVLAAGEYPIVARCFAVYWDADKDAAPGLFVSWLQTEEGEGLIKELGWIPVYAG